MVQVSYKFIKKFICFFYISKNNYLFSGQNQFEFIKICGFWVYQNISINTIIFLKDI